VPATRELPAERGRSLAEPRAIRAGSFGEDRPQLALERHTLPGRARLQAADGIVIDVPDHDLGHGGLLIGDIEMISRRQLGLGDRCSLMVVELNHPEGPPAWI
jgi:hypothetical protein